MIGALCDVRVWRAGALGMKGVVEEDEEARVGEASSAKSAALRDSRSIILNTDSSHKHITDTEVHLNASHLLL